LARGGVFAERAVSAWRTTGGSDSMNVIQHEIFIRDPSKITCYGTTMRWKTTVDEVPRGLGPNEFEDWLWRREKLRQPGQLADLRMHSTFPGFSGLPNENNVDLDFYETVDTSRYRPRRHWCFLGEIKDFTWIIRMQMAIMDVDGKTTQLFFYTDGRGREIAPPQLQKGYTVAILYAQRHTFMFEREQGIRHEHPQMIKIFPLSLKELLALSDQVQQFSTKLDGLRKCHGCGKKVPAASVKHCSKCSFFWYCNRACQEAGWKEKGHKADCKLLKDPDLRGFFLLRWGEYRTHLRFPLRVAEHSET